MPDEAVRSRRTRSAQDLAAQDLASPERFVVVGEGVLAESLAVRLAATHLPVLPADPDAAAEALRGAASVLVVGYAADFPVDTADRPTRREHVTDLARRTASAAGAAGVRVIGISSAVVCGASPGRAAIVDDEPVDADAAATPGLVGTLVAFERALVEAAAAAERPVTVLRTAPLVGPGIDTFVTRHFEAPRVLAVRDCPREWQFLHVDDLVEAVRVVVVDGLTGLLGVGAVRDDGSPDVLPVHRVAALAGKRVLTLPASSAFALAESLHRVGAVPAPPAELAYVVYPWTVVSGGLHQAGWRPAWSSAECVGVLAEGLRGGLTVAGRRVGARDAAALGAAGAAVALLGTAAVWRQARGRR